ncbi:MAG: beta-propeller domain-containing protein [archaeon]|nr:beta-propeller domain-containing protein [archaeon]
MKKILAIGIVTLLVCSVGLAIFYAYRPHAPPSSSIPSIAKAGFKTFSSEEDFKDYLRKSANLQFEEYFVGGGVVPIFDVEIATPAVVPPVPMPTPMPLPPPGIAKEAEPERVSATTVQVPGIDEPDIVKTDGKEIYFSRFRLTTRWSGIEEKKIEIIEPYMETKVIKAFPPENLSVESSIEGGGNLLLHENILVIFSTERIYGYNVSVPEAPEKKWGIELRGEMVGARLYEDKIYLITRSKLNYSYPCPVEPLSMNGVPVKITCKEIYHPVIPVPVDVTYHIFVLDPYSGEVEKRTSFVGSSGSSVIYMSPNAVYVTYSYSGDIAGVAANFIEGRCSDIIPAGVIEKVKKLKEYEISTTAKLTELRIILESYLNSLDTDERIKVENEIYNRANDYFKENKREMERTGIAKISLDKLDVIAAGDIPGIPLNQFSLDEYEGYLRIATTVGERNLLWFFGSERESANDIYVLDLNLNAVGSIKDLGIGERIYSVRFMGDKAYVVTFREIDPFFVIDLSKTEKPELKGELKIPGYSSYLHPLTKDKILGIGKEGSKVKISIFDVSSAENPVELDKYMLNEYWSDILTTHHAFLLDEKHEIFFLPASYNGYIFSCKDNQLKLLKVVSEIIARRAIYIEDYLYVIGDDKITVLEETKWEKVKEMEI